MSVINVNMTLFPSICADAVHVDNVMGFRGNVSFGAYILNFVIFILVMICKQLNTVTKPFLL